MAPDPYSSTETILDCWLDDQGWWSDDPVEEIGKAKQVIPTIREAARKIFIPDCASSYDRRPLINAYNSSMRSL